MIFVFDLDFTIWDCGGTWCDHTNPPYRHANGHILDRTGRKIRLYREVPEILEMLNEKGFTIAAASRTHAPDIADTLMKMFDIKKYFQMMEIYPGSKLAHFRSIQKHSGMPYDKMFFFDDEYRNIEDVGSLGVSCVWVKDGLNKALFDDIHSLR